MEQLSIQPNKASVTGFLDALNVYPDVQIEQDRFFDAFLKRAARTDSNELPGSTLSITTLQELTKTTREFMRFPELVETIGSYGMRACTDSECLALYTQTPVLARYPNLLCIMDPVIIPFDYNGPNAVDTPFCLRHHLVKVNPDQKKIGLCKVDGSFVLGIPSDATICVASV